MPQRRSGKMASQIVMDHTGGTRHQFDAADVEALFKSEERFRSLTKVGFTAAVRASSGRVDLENFGTGPLCPPRLKKGHPRE